MNLDNVFDVVEIESDYLRKLVEKSIYLIRQSLAHEELSFGNISERQTYTSQPVEVIEDGDINIDSRMLMPLDDDLALAFIGHALATHFLGNHHCTDLQSVQETYEADKQAKHWGFDIEKLRKYCGSPKRNSLL